MSLQQPINQHTVNEISRLTARIDTICENIQQAACLAIMECDGSIARITGRQTVKCSKCRVDVDTSKLNQPGRCTDRYCPLKKEIAE